MKRLIILALVALSGLMIVSVINAEDSSTYVTKSVWIGGHYTTLTDYRRKVGEYNLGNDELLPEFRFDFLSQKSGSIFDLKTHYYDDRNITGELNAYVTDRLSASVQYRSLTKQFGQDLLTNLETREWLSTKPGGKILTHDLSDSGADYNIHRQEVLTRVSLLLSHENNVRFMATHRAILEKGSVQQVNTSHCYSCHVVSQTRSVDNRTQEFEAGLQADVSKMTAGYSFGYRSFSSHALIPTYAYDSAAHPVNGGSGPEFVTRLNFSDTTLPVGALPNSHKMSHKARLKGQVAGGYLASSIVYNSVKNTNSGISSDAYGASAQYLHALSARTRMVTRASFMRQKTDNYYVNLPTFREGRPGPEISFDFTRYSSLNRLNAAANVELVSRLNPKTVLSLLAAYNRVRRDDYPFHGSDYTTNKYTGQARLRYHPMMKLNTTFSYRFEKTSRPFESGRGLFEESGRNTLKPLADNFAFIFYFQREALRYQSITTLPTDRHEVKFDGSYVLGPRVSMLWSVKGSYDRNNDLDSLDIQHVSIQPAVSFSLVMNNKWTNAFGYSYSYEKSRLAVAVPLFDG